MVGDHLAQQGFIPAQINRLHIGCALSSDHLCRLFNQNLHILAFKPFVERHLLSIKLLQGGKAIALPLINLLTIIRSGVPGRGLYLNE